MVCAHELQCLTPILSKYAIDTVIATLFVADVTIADQTFGDNLLGILKRKYAI